MNGISYRRQLAGMTQEELAKAMGVSARTVSAWENGAHHPGKKMPKLAETLGCKEVDLLTPPPEATASA